MKNQKIQQNNKGTSKNNPDKEAELKKKAVSKEQIAELMKEKKKMQEELDELWGQTTGGKAVCVLAFFGLLVLFLGIFVGIVKLDVGNFATDVLAPMIGDVLVIRTILPSDLQKKSPKEVAAEEQAASEQADLVVRILKNMTPANRAAIISNMSVANASQVTVMMEQ